MEREPAPADLFLCPPPGTRVQDWLLVSCHGFGGSGVVYRALRIGRESEGYVALKMSLYPWDPRVMREVGLLSLILHPSVVRLLGHGFWQHPSGAFFPFLVMEWVEGPPLYAWAREHAPTQPQVLQVLAQLARALETTHACHAVHRDVKGDNVKVRSADGRAVLLDFGAGNYQSAARITSQPLPPGTPGYRAPEALLFAIHSCHSPGASYQPGPADDVYALGVTAYRLVTGQYPPGPALRQDEAGTWHLEQVPLPSPRELDPRVDSQLSALILRMLSVSPEARGTAGEIAEVLEAAAGPRALPERTRSRVQAMAWRARSAWVLAGALLVLWAWKAVHTPPPSAPAREQVDSPPGRAEGDTANLGETAPEATSPPVQESSQPETISQEPSPKPFSEQLTPDAKGRCPGPKQVPINGGCWMEYSAKDAEECEKNGLVYIKDRCYAPAMGSRRQPPPTSAPADFR